LALVGALRTFGAPVPLTLGVRLSDSTHKSNRGIQLSSYTKEDLCERGTPFAMAMLLRAITEGEPFVTYGAIKAELEQQLDIDSIFTIHIGAVAGALMNDIMEQDPKAPLINVIIARPDGIPGRGASGYLANRYKDASLRDWENVSRKKKLEVVERERNKIFEYPHWQKIATALYGKIRPLAKPNLQGNEHDFPPLSARGGEAESPEHRRLKIWVSENPEKIGLKALPQSVKVEAKLLSGDEIDVLFSTGMSFHAVEVKSSRSNDADFLRGIYQCVKYREVKRAEHAPFDASVEAILVTEASIPPELAERAALLGVKWRQVSVNSKE